MRTVVAPMIAIGRVGPSRTSDERWIVKESVKPKSGDARTPGARTGSVTVRNVVSVADRRFLDGAVKAVEDQEDDEAEGHRPAMCVSNPVVRQPVGRPIWSAKAEAETRMIPGVTMPSGA
jgi:hypothetical protein